MSDEYISKKQAICAIDNDDEYSYYLTKRNIDSIPSISIIDHARAIKEYCEQFPECEGCRFYNNLPFRCTFGICPQEWDLPEEKKPPIFVDSAPLKDCKNTAESYGEICVKCNKCGRFGKGKE